jgi:hypothetical protein
MITLCERAVANALWVAAAAAGHFHLPASRRWIGHGSAWFDPSLPLLSAEAVRSIAQFEGVAD